MAIKISLSAGSIASDSLLIPDIEGIMKLAKGDLGISDAIKKNFMFGKMAASSLDEEAMSIFLKAGGINITNELSSYKDSVSGRLKIPIDDITQNPVSDKMGIKALEKTVLQTVFESQKPYLEAMMLMSESMVDFEDIIARMSGILSPDGKSLRPNKNTKSLYSKLNSVEEAITKMKNLSKSKTASKFSKLTTEQKKNGIPMDVINNQTPSNKIVINSGTDSVYEWEIIGTEYSTGVKLEGIKYETIYKDILDNNLILDSNKESLSIKKYGKDKVIEDEKPPTIVFAHYNDSGVIDDISDGKWAWLNRNYSDGAVGPGTTKWYGEWEQLGISDKGKYDNYMKDYISNRLKKKNNGVPQSTSVKNGVYNFIKRKINTQDIINQGNDVSFMNLINETNPENGLDIGVDNTEVVSMLTKGRRKMFLPKKINYKGKDVFIDPESDYNLQIIKLVPSNDIYYQDELDIYNQQLKRTTPLVGNYQGVNVKDSLIESEYSNSYLRNGYIIKTEGVPMRVQTMSKFLTSNDTKVSYIIEGTRREKPSSIDVLVNNPSTDDKTYYKRSDLFSATGKFIDSMIDISVDLLPQLKEIYKLFSAPHEFIFDLILEKVGDNFELLSSEIIEKFSDANSISDITEKVSFVQNDLILKKFIFIDEVTGKMKFLFDSVAMFDLMGFNFGLQLTNLVPKFVINKNGGSPDNLNSIKKSINGNFKDGLIGDIGKSNNIVSSNLNNRLDNPDSSSNGVGYENISIKYSTGKKIKGVDYDYIYITQEVEKLIKKGDELFNVASMSDVNKDLEAAIGALQNYDEALAKDPNNLAIKDRINELKDKFKVQLNMIFEFLFNLVSMPIKIAKNVLGTVIDLFDGMTLKTITTEIPEFLSFKWILDNFKINTILDFIGIKFNPALLVEWISKAKGGEFNADQKFNLNQVMTMPFFQQLPDVNIDELLIIAKKPLSILTQLFKFIEGIITGIIQFILDIINIDKVINVPDFNISKFIDGDLSIAELQELLNGAGNDLLNNSNLVGNKPIVPNNFLYDIKLPNGEIIKGLNRVELDSYIESNSDIQYEYNFKK